jgi:hypothetical protein
MKNLKSVKQTAKTFSMTFEVETPSQLKRLEALSILCGNFNPMKDRLKDKQEVLRLMNIERHLITFDELIDAIVENII